MNILITPFIIACFILFLSIYICIYALTNIHNNYVRKIENKEYIKGQVDEKLIPPLSVFNYKKHYIVVDQQKYHVSKEDYESVEVGNNYLYILSDNKYEILKIVKDINLYKNKVTMKDVIKQTKIYQNLKNE
ncbi:TPA: hypothetical protein PT687_002547 [Staphylococcus aureus]|nr:hypothetical protein [Staphylococcus aureus]